MSNLNEFSYGWDSTYSHRNGFESFGGRALTTLPLQLRQQRLFVCSLCNKEFKSPQALGGHHHAHKRERETLRMDYEENMSRYPREAGLFLATQTQPLQLGLPTQGMEPAAFGDQTKPYLDQLGRRLEEVNHEDLEVTPMVSIDGGESILEMDAGELDLTLRP